MRLPRLCLPIACLCTPRFNLRVPANRQAERYCEAKGWTIVTEYVEPGQSAASSVPTLELKWRAREDSNL